MPRKNSLKIYVENGFYHLYNRGVEKRKIFLDERDYRVFLHYLKKYLSESKLPLRTFESLAGKANLLCYCLMPNHFHLLVKQIPANGITKLMNRIGTCYGMYFNKRYDRVGPLFQGNYKAVRVETDGQLLHLSRYIHLNPIAEGLIRDVSNLNSYSYSSYGDFLGLRKSKWLKPKEVLSFFKAVGKRQKGSFSYQSFVEKYEGEEDDLSSLVLDS